MPIEPIKIPQNVYIEDRIVGPLTLRQVLIVTLGGGFSYALWASVSKAYGLVTLPIQILTWIPAVISAIFAFVRINDVSMTRLMLLMMERINKPSLRTWSPRRGLIINIRTFTKPAKQSSQLVSGDKNIDRIDELSALLDRNVDGVSVATTQELQAAQPVTPKRSSISIFHDISPAPRHG